ncbi:MAG: GIY-YIG nuclease family protein [Anaerolineales bacterium]|nr:GIY-YIG nuclease family protein [Anaerolineales bacterium]
MVYVYVLKCKDGSYYTGMTDNLERHMEQHHAGTFEDSYTQSRRPVVLVWSESFTHHDDAFRRERQIKAWSRKKKGAWIRSHSSKDLARTLRLRSGCLSQNEGRIKKLDLVFVDYP